MDKKDKDDEFSECSLDHPGFDDIVEVIHPETGEILKVGEKGREEFWCPSCDIDNVVQYLIVSDPVMPMKPFKVFACTGCKQFYWCKRNGDDLIN